MFGLSLTKLLVLGLAVFGAWHLFRWIERRADGGGKSTPPADPAGGKPQDASAPAENDDSVELIRDPETGVWRPKRPGE